MPFICVVKFYFKKFSKLILKNHFSKNRQISKLHRPYFKKKKKLILQKEVRPLRPEVTNYTYSTTHRNIRNIFTLYVACIGVFA